MKLYIRATGNISPQNTFGHPPLLQETVIYSGARLRCVEPDYNSLIDPKLIRRMSRIIKMGVAAAKECLREAEIVMPDAIVTGTAYGCLEDTGLFLKKMVEQKEEMLTPTAFIQSTHNTIGAQIALLLQCHQYNNTFVHRGFSFESALMDSMMLLREGAANNVLTGGIDEITDISYSILNRFGLYKREEIKNNELFKSKTKGTIAGEGAAFFLVTNQPSDKNYVSIDGIRTFYKPQNSKEIELQVQSFLLEQSVTTDEIDLVVNGRNGDVKTDDIYRQLENGVFHKIPAASYKHFCGEYPTSISFALWLAANAIKNGGWPGFDNVNLPMKRILIYNHYQQLHHSLLLISAC